MIISLAVASKETDIAPESHVENAPDEFVPVPIGFLRTTAAPHNTRADEMDRQDPSLSTPDHGRGQDKADINQTTPFRTLHPVVGTKHTTHLPTPQR